MIVLDTNVLSAVMRRTPEPLVVAWLDRQPALSMWTTAVCVFEIAFGLQLLEPGRRRAQLQEAFVQAIDEDLEGRVLTFDRAAAHAAAIIARQQREAGRPAEIRDVQIAGIVSAHRATLATRNTRHFDGIGIEVVNPWEGN